MDSRFIMQVGVWQFGFKMTQIYLGLFLRWILVMVQTNICPIWHLEGGFETWMFLPFSGYLCLLLMPQNFVKYRISQNGITGGRRLHWVAPLGGSNTKMICSGCIALSAFHGWGARDHIFQHAPSTRWAWLVKEGKGFKILSSPPAVLTGYARILAKFLPSWHIYSSR